MDYTKLLDDIINLLGDDFNGAVGLRGDDINFNIDDSLSPSHYWEDGVQTDEELNGTSAIIISADWLYDPLSVIEHNLTTYAHLVENYGDNIYVIIGDIASGGEDIGEIIIPNAKVAMIIKGVDLMPQPKIKLPYDVPYHIYVALKEDAAKEGIPATQLLIRLIENNHKSSN